MDEYAEQYEVRCYQNGQLVHRQPLVSTLLLGRQRPTEPEPFQELDTDEGPRLVIAQLNERSISREHVRLELSDQHSLRVVNRSQTNAILVDGQELLPGGSYTSPIPVRIGVGRKTLQVQAAGTMHSLMASQFPTPGPRPQEDFPSIVNVCDLSGSPEGLVECLRALTEVLQCAAHSDSFLQRACQAIVEMMDLDACHVLMLGEDGSWQDVAVHATDSQTERFVAQEQVLTSVVQDKSTYWGVPESSTADSAGPLRSVIASPILEASGDVWGVIYAERRRVAAGAGGPGVRPGVAKYQAMLLDVFAGGLATGLARVRQERAALQAQVQFEQFFTPELARHLAEKPDLLEARDAEVSVLFFDIRGFSRIAERVGPAQTLLWTSQVLNEVSDCVLAEDGVLVDYVGDALMAMWGAPEQDAAHATRACRAALAMLARLPELNRCWQPQLGESFGFSIGVNSGPARVGNVGSRFKFKYGPQGTTVNLASRVQGATKYLRCPLLVTHSTHALLDQGFATRRLCQVRVVNLERPIELYEVVANAREDWPQLKAAYEQALSQFEGHNFHGAVQDLASLLASRPDDGPTQVLLARASACLLDDPQDLVWELEGK